MKVGLYLCFNLLLEFLLELRDSAQYQLHVTNRSIHAVFLPSDNSVYCFKIISEDVSREFQLPLNHSYCGDMHMTL
jgi:hypothetical protein